jgi:hypothetical protein
MKRSILFIGLGGSGGKTLRFLKRDLALSLSELGWDMAKGIPQCFQFLHIDTPTNQDGDEIKSADMLPESEYLGLVGKGVDFPAVTQMLDATSGIMHEQVGWRVMPAGLNGLPIQEGAGAYRAVGRTIAIAQIGVIKRSLEAAIARINGGEAIGDLLRIQSLHAERNPGMKNAENNVNQDNSPIAIVVSSLAGGTGAGLLIDVFDVLRSLESAKPWGGKSVGILYTPEVFANINSSLIGGVQPNSLAAIAELLNGQYWHGATNAMAQVHSQSAIGMKKSEILDRNGVTSVISQSGPMYPFLVGSTNSEGITFENGVQVFETIASSLVAWCLDPVVQGKLMSYVIGNWDKRTEKTRAEDKDLLINVGDAEEVAKPALQAMGCARVSVGTTYLESFASQKLAKEVLDSAINYHVSSAEAIEVRLRLKTTDSREIARYIAADKKSWFIDMAKLREKGRSEEDNQVVDFLLPKNQYDILKSETQATVMRGLGDHKRNAQEYIENIEVEVSNAIVDFEKNAKKLIDSQVDVWVKTKPLEVINVLEQSIASYGLVVSAELIDALIDELTNPVTGVTFELAGPNELETYEYYSKRDEWIEQAKSKLGGLTKNFTPQTEERVGQAVGAAVNYAAHVADAQVRIIAIKLLESFTDHFLRPLRSALESAAIDSSERFQKECSLWPSWESTVGEGESRPPKSEFTLIKTSEFGKVFDDLLEKTTTEGKGEAIRSISSGSFMREMESKIGYEVDAYKSFHAIEVKEDWFPGATIHKASKSPQQKVSVSINFEPRMVLRRANLWIRRKDTAFDNLLNSKINSYTMGNDPAVTDREYKERQDLLVEQIAKALTASAPLVKVNVPLEKFLHQTNLGAERILSNVPLGSGHPSRKRVEALLQNYVDLDNQGNADFGGIFREDDSCGSIQITSVLKAAYHPYLFQSLLSPIDQGWNASNSSRDQIRSFWSYRRARIAGEAIPAPQEHIICMIRGWFTARFFGLLELPAVEEVRPILIAQPWSSDMSPARFPSPLLTHPGNPREALFSVLEALTLAMVEVGSKSNTTPLYPYISLRDFGKSIPSASSILHYQTPNPMITRWLESGEISSRYANGTKNEEQLRKGIDALGLKLKDYLTFEDRKQFMLSSLGKSQEHLSKVSTELFRTAQNDPNALSRKPFTPALRTTSEQHKDLIEMSLNSLIDAIQEYELSSDEDGHPDLL